MASLEERDVRQLRVHRHRQVQALQRRGTAPGTHQQAGGSSFLRFLLVEAGQSAARYDAGLGRFDPRLSVRKHRGLAKVAVARTLAVRSYLRLREDWTCAQLCKAVVQVSPSHSVVER